jgi:hypothetical protein
MNFTLAMPQWLIAARPPRFMMPNAGELLIINIPILRLLDGFADANPDKVGRPQE